MFGRKKRYSKKKVQRWSDKGEVEKIVAVLEKGDVNSKIFAITELEVHNFMNVKRALFAALDDENKDVALRCVKVIKTMGANREEIEKIKEIEKKWS